MSADIKDIIIFLLISHFFVLLLTLIFKIAFMITNYSDVYLDSEKKEIDFSFLEGGESDE